MSSPSKKKGYTFEKQSIDQAVALGLTAERAWGSNGRAKGWHEEVDIMIEDVRIQCKRRRKLAGHMKPGEHVDAQLIREDYGESFMVLPYSLFLQWLRKLKDVKELLPSS